MKIASGSLDRKLLIEQATNIADTFGQQQQTWTTLATVWAQRLALKTDQKVELHPNMPDKSPGNSVVATGRYLIRWRGDLAIGMRITVDGAASYILTAIEEPDRRTTLVLTVSA